MHKYYSKLSFIRNAYFLFSLAFVLGFSACKNTKEIKVDRNDNTEINSATSPDSLILSMIEPYKTELDKKMLDTLNYAEVDLLKGRPESNLGNFVADLSFDIASAVYKPEDNKEIDFCLLNEGGLRVAIAKGPITLGKTYELMPFRNELVVISLTYEKTMELFDYLALSGGEPISKASLVIKNGLAENILINDEAPDSTRTYKVLTTDYLARGGDKMYFFEDPINSEIVGVLLRDAIIDYLIAEDAKGNKITSKIEGRIINE